MKKVYFTSFKMIATAITLLLAMQLNAQRVVQVAPGLDLVETIDSDTLATGERVDPNTIYELERGDNKVYLLNGSISNRDYNLTIRSAGTGERPFLVPLTVSGSSERPFRPRDNITLQGLHITNMDELGGVNQRMIRCSEDDIRVIIDDCWLDRSSQSALRLDNPNMKIYVTNSIISNIGFPDDPNNGRVVDDRGNPMDTLWIENTTIYNVTSRILRDDGGLNNYFKLHQSTIYNVGQRCLTLGETNEVIITNNIFHNVGFLGKDTASSSAIIELDSIDVGPQSVMISYNNFFTDTAVTDALPVSDTITSVPVFDETAQAFVDDGGTESTLLFDWADFTNPPAVPEDIVTANWDPLNSITAWDTVTLPWSTPSVPYEFDFQNEVINTSSSSDGQLGDLNWEFVSGSVGLFDVKTDPNSHNLQVIPNPVENYATFSFNLQRSAYVEVDIYSVAGVLVKKVFRDVAQSGINSVEFNSDELNSGIYITKLTTQGQSSIQKMVVH